MIEWLALGIALFGAVLSLINTVHAVSQTKPKLLVRFLNNYAPPDMRLFGVSIEVINVGSIPLRIREVGFSLSPIWRRKIERAMVLPNGEVGATLPCVIEPRSQASFYFPPVLQGRLTKRITAAYVKTDCGLYFVGRSPALKDFADRHVSAE